MSVVAEYADEYVPLIGKALREKFPHARFLPFGRLRHSVKQRTMLLCLGNADLSRLFCLQDNNSKILCKGKQMTRIRIWVAVCALLVAGEAMAEPASEASVRQLLEVTQAHKLVDNMKSQMGGVFNRSYEMAAGKKTPTPAQQAAIDKMKSRMQTLLSASLDWDKLEPIYIRVYRETFTQEEIQGMVEFYKTPAGQAVITKMPTVMLKTSSEMQASVKDMYPEMQKIQADFEAEFKAAASAK